ncbi:hypothetical protein ACFQE0_20950 [Methylobacterium komagatae]|uniref:Uncharacterized protein n=1 Tax=Methylobacterium komagatae TaxID=374425 RepID=A0ABW2BN23_9HYPH
MRDPPIPTADPMMRRLVALVDEQLPDSTHHARLSLLAQLHALEQEAVKDNSDPSTLRSIHAVQDFVQRCDGMKSLA